MSKKVLVTGGSGFLGSWCIQVLLTRGYIVHTTVRTIEKAKFLELIPGATARLKIFSGIDLLTPGAFEEAMTGCEYVLHTASPFFVLGGSEDNLVKPAVEGTKNVLDTCNKLGVKKVVLTASTACIYVTYGTMPEEHVYTEQDWSPIELLTEKKNWYSLSKTKAEKLAWEMSKESSCTFELSTMNPTLIYGPQLPGQKHLNTSSCAIVAYFDGSTHEIEDSCKSIVDVRDVAEAHVAALEKDNAMGNRYLLICGSPHQSVIAQEVCNALPDRMKKNVPTVLSTKQIPTIMAQAPPNPVLYDVSLSTSVLGIKYHSVSEMVKTAVDSLLENGFNNKNMYSIDKL